MKRRLVMDQTVVVFIWEESWILKEALLACDELEIRDTTSLPSIQDGPTTKNAWSKT